MASGQGSWSGRLDGLGVVERPAQSLVGGLEDRHVLLDRLPGQPRDVVDHGVHPVQPGADALGLGRARDRLEVVDDVVRDSSVPGSSTGSSVMPPRLPVRLGVAVEAP